jgi:hypothetical protein
MIEVLLTQYAATLSRQLTGFNERVVCVTPEISIRKEWNNSVYWWHVQDSQTESRISMKKCTQGRSDRRTFDAARWVWYNSWCNEMKSNETFNIHRALPTMLQDWKQWNKNRLRGVDNKPLMTYVNQWRWTYKHSTSSRDGPSYSMFVPVQISRAPETGLVHVCSVIGRTSWRHNRLWW